MERYTGRSILQGIAIGKIFFCSREEPVVPQRSITDPEAELERYENARKTAIRQLQELFEKAAEEVGEASASIFQAQIMILEDHGFHTCVKEIIEFEKRNAEYAVTAAGDRLSRRFSAMDDEYMKARSADIRDIAGRVAEILQGGRKEKNPGKAPVILAARELTPGETVQMDKTMLLGLVTEQGSTNSHTAILARAMNLPALTGIPVGPEMNGRTAVLDGFTGELILNPDEETLRAYQKKQQEELGQRKLWQQWKNKDDVTLDGKQVELYANIGGVEDLAKVLENDAGGIGLFRSEFLYLGKNDYPTEEEQFQAYKTVAETMAGKKVIIRTLDMGADKQADYFRMEKEENPAMGYRGIRICLDRTEIFKTQLRAILRASAYGNLSVMYPMIISVKEVRQAKSIMEEVKRELEEKGILLGKVEQGIMIETPAAVLISDLLAREVDFFSIGTNDLTQYLLAADRQNARLDSLYDPRHPAVLRAIRLVIANGHQGGCRVGICGELGADTTLTETFLKMGIDELSVHPTAILPIRKVIRETDLGNMDR